LIEDDILIPTGPSYDYEYTSFGIAYENDNAYILYLPSETSDTVATQAYRYHIDTGNWTRWTKTNTCGVVNPNDNKLYLGAGDRNYIEKERKTGSRVDFCDREYDLSIPASSVDGDQVTISSVANVEVGDVIVQEQYINISNFNRLLKKLDLDPGLDDTDYYLTLYLSAGDNLLNKMTVFATKLTSDDNLGTYSVTGTTFEDMKDTHNTWIATLNSASSDTHFVDYREITSLLPYEGVIDAVDSLLNILTIHESIGYLEGDITLYKHIPCELDYAPQHFGNPESMKQVNWGTVIFDGNNYYRAILAFASDLNKGFEEIDIYGNGNGSFGSFTWEDVPWGGEGSDVPDRTLIPRQQQRCRYIFVKIKHRIAREGFKIVGITLNARETSKNAYR
jgi:hypothetical protein